MLDQIEQPLEQSQVFKTKQVGGTPGQHPTIIWFLRSKHT